MVYDYKKEMMKRSTRKKIKAALIIFCVLVVLSLANYIYLEIVQLDEAGNLSSIYVKNLIYKITFSSLAGIITFTSFLISGIFIKRNLNDYFKLKDIPVRKIYVYTPAIIAAVITLISTKDMFYQNAMTYLNAVSFNVKDPILGYDIGYYILKRPFLISIYNFMSTVWIATILYTAGYYTVVFTTVYSQFDYRQLKVNSIISHNLINIATYFLIKTFSFKFRKEGLLFGQVVESVGASYVDVKIWMPYYTIIPFVLLAITGITFYFLKKKEYKKSAYTIGVFPAIWVLISVISFIVQGLVVKPNEKDFESPYLVNNISMTRKAYGLDAITIYEYEKIEPLTRKILADNPQTVDNIRIVDYESTLISNMQLQSNTLFYTFVDGDILNYNINGKDTAIFSAVREINHAQLPDKSYINTKYRYTHGYGLVMNPINRVNNQGQIVYILNNLSHDSLDDFIKVERPEVYYGELTYDYAIVNATGINEIDYDGNRETRYQGQGGIKLTSINRILFAAKYNDLNLITSRYAKNATLLPNRQIINRAQMAVPFLHIDNDAYVVLDNQGRMKWVLDGYTYSNQFPYSQYKSGFNYIRNSVKVIIDAYDGKVEYYVIDPEDPIIKTYMKIYPGIFITDDLPESIREHMKYPEFLFKVQTEVLRKYHLNEEKVGDFYSQNDLWAIAKYPSGGYSGNVVDIEPYYIVSNLPDTKDLDPELLLMRPYTPSSEQRHNMVSWLSVRNSYENYGELVLINFPRNMNVLGPYQVEVKINQIDSVSKNMTLWSQGGSDVYKGSLLVVPIGNSILYVEPIYIKAAGKSATPEVREVVTGYQLGDEFIYGVGPNFNAAINNMFNVTTDGNVVSPGDSNVTDQGLKNELLEKYNELKKQLEELGELIENMYK